MLSCVFSLCSFLLSLTCLNYIFEISHGRGLQTPLHVAADFGNMELETVLKAGYNLKIVYKVSPWISLCLTELVAESSLLDESLERQY